MFEIASKLFCFVTTTVSFIYATRICWVCGKKCTFNLDPIERKDLLKASIPAGFAIYSFGFFVVFSCALDGRLTISVMALTSALIVSHFVVSMAMPTLKRPPQDEQSGQHETANPY